MKHLMLDKSTQFSRAPSESHEEWISRVATHPPSEYDVGAEGLSSTQAKEIVKDIQHLFSSDLIEREEESLGNTCDGTVHLDDQSRRSERLTEILPLIVQLWRVDSEQLDFATQTLADGSRNMKWRVPLGKSGVLKLFLEIFKRHELRQNLKVHVLRLIGNCCADIDENRAYIAESKENIMPIIQQLKDTSLIPFALPVLFNICVDYEPNQLLASNVLLTQELITLISSPSLLDRSQSLLDYVCRILTLLASQPSEVEFAPDTTAAILLRTAANNESPVHLDDFVSLINIAVVYLQSEKFQKAFLRAEGSLNDVITILVDSYARFDDQLTNNETHDPNLLTNLRTSLNQVLSDISALPEFTEACPIPSQFPNTLEQWLIAPCAKAQLQVGACIMLGNLARSEASCIEFVHNSQIHKSLINIASRENSSQILHAALGFLKNLAIPIKNKNPIGEAGIFPILSQIWARNTLPQVQFAAISLGRQLTIDTFENVYRLIRETDSNTTNSNISPLGAIFATTDDMPIKMEIARLNISICRVMYSQTGSSLEATQSTRIRFFHMHPEISDQLIFVVSQTKWPVLRSEGWFALALCARFPEGAAFVSKLLQDPKLFKLLVDLISGNRDVDSLPISSESSINDSIVPNTPPHDPESIRKHDQTSEMARLDRQNALVLVGETLQNDGSELSISQKMKLQDLINTNGKTIKDYKKDTIEAKEIVL